MRRSLSNSRFEELGKFKSSGIMILCDPCYLRKDTNCVYRIEVIPGYWNSRVYYFGDRVRILEAEVSTYSCLREELLVEDAGVDSGQFGFFDDTLFPYTDERLFVDDAKIDIQNFYGKCCTLTLNEKQAGIIDGLGVVSSSGFGDGNYPISVRRDVNGKIARVRIEFISEEEY